MTTVNIHEAKTNFSALVDRAHAGEEIIVSKAGKPFARLVPLANPEERVAGRYPMAVPASFFEGLPEDEEQAWNS